MANTITKALIGKEDLSLKTSGTAKSTFTRTDASSRTLTLEQIDAAHIQFRTLAKQIDDLVDGGYDVPIKPSKIFGGATNTNGHTVPDAADDTFVMRATTDTLTNKTLTAPTISGGSLNNATISTPTLTGGTISAAAMSGGTINGTAISNAVISSAAISGGTINAVAMSNGTISAATISGATLVSCAADTISESASNSGVTIDGCIIKDGGVEAVTDKGGGSNLVPKTIEIGDWDMDASQTYSVAHGLAAGDYKKVRSVSVIIRDDSDGVYCPLNCVDSSGSPTFGGVDFVSGGVDDTNVYLAHDGGATHFSSAVYDDFGGVAGNRGWVTLWMTE